MPKVGERKQKGGIVGEWDGTTWRRVEDLRASVVDPVLAGGEAEAAPATAEEIIRQLNPVPVSGEEEVAGTLRRLPAELAQTASGYLPAIGGLVGGALGTGAGPAGTIGGAALGSAGGEAAQRLIRQVALGSEAPSTAGEAAVGIGGAGALGAAGAAVPYVGGAALRGARAVGVEPAIAAAKAGGKALYEGKGVLAAGLHAVEAGGKAILKPAVKAQVTHAIKRSVKELVEEAPKVVSINAAAAKAAKPEVVEDILGDMTKRVTSMRDLGIDPKDISKSLVKHYASTGKGAGLTAGKMRGLVDDIIQQNPKAETNLADEMAGRVIEWAKSGKLDSRAKMDVALRELYPAELTPANSRKVVDFILDTKKIGPKRTAAEMGMSTNEQIRGARAGTLTAPIHKGR